MRTQPSKSNGANVLYRNDKAGMTTGYEFDLELIIGRFGDLAEKIRAAHVADDELELSELIDDLLEEAATASEFMETHRKKPTD
jgi:hypothetical protein